MHIAFLTPEYPHPEIAHAAGIGTSIQNLVKALVRQGVVVTVFVYGQKKTKLIQDQGVSLHLISHRSYRFMGWYWHRKYIANYCNQVIASQKIDILEAPDWTGITAFMSFKIPLVIRFHGSDTYFCHLENRKQKRKNFWFEKLAVQKAEAYIAPTTFAAEVSKKIFGIKNKIVTTIHYGLELKRFENPKPTDFQRGLIVYIGTIIRKKGVFELPAIFELVAQKYPEARLVLIGSDAKDLHTQSSSTWELVQSDCPEALLQKISYLGKIPYQEVQNYIKKAHVCVLPTFAETLGMVTIESMAMQKPVVNSNLGWAQELIVEGESGFLVHPQNHLAYATQINALLDSDALAQHIGNQARKRVEAVFDIDKIVQENIDFYRTLIN